MTEALETDSRNITTKQFQILTDINLVWDFFVDTYDKEYRAGAAAPFFEYALQLILFMAMILLSPIFRMAGKSILKIETKKIKYVSHFAATLKKYIR